jgi:internalin A
MYTKFELIAIDRINSAKQNKSRYLDLSGLFLTRIPIDISEMIYLNDLDLSFNRFSNFPIEIAKLTNLYFLDFSNNNLQNIHFEIGNIYSFKSINLTNNSLNYLPEELFYINEDAEIIYNNNPFLLSIPIEISSQEDLNYINFYLNSINRKNKVNRLFETKLLIVGKGNVGKTTLMNIIKNNNYNVKIGKEETTHGINLDYKNEKIFFPAILPYYDFSRDENKLWIYNNMDDDDEDEDELENYQNGKIISKINLNKEHLEHISQSDLYTYYLNNDYSVIEEPYYEFENIYIEKKIRINIWDFGGQEILYSTHQFFLTQRSVYIYVWEPRNDDDDESFDYWLNIVSRLSNNSPILVVMNKSDIRIKNIDENSYLKKFGNIVGFFRISCYTKEGINLLIENIHNTISNLPHLGEKLPNKWNNIRNKLKKQKNEYITFEKFKKICSLKNLEETLYISDFLNDIGDIVYFKNNPILNKIVILNPNWLTKAIYELIHSLKIQNNNGIFNSSDLNLYLNVEKYPPSKHYEILSLMEEFEICFKIIGSKDQFIIPTLLKASLNNLDLINSLKNPQSFKYKIIYKFIPSGIIERLLCRLNSYIFEDYFWRFGAIFSNETCKAFIELNRSEKTLNLFLNGKFYESLYSVIIHELFQIHKDLKLNISDFDELYACNCSNCSNSQFPFMFKKNVLLKFIENDKKTITCENSIFDVNVKELIIGYKPNPHENSLLKSIVQTLSQVQTRIDLIKNFDENQLNTYFQDLLRPHVSDYDFFLNEQSLKGKSFSGKKQGELDIVLETKHGTMITFIESFILKNLNQEVIIKHLNKTITNYDSNGLKEKYIIVYCKSINYLDLTKKYYDFICKYELEKISIIDNSDITNYHSSGSEIKVFKTIYNRSEIKLTMYHILVNLII